MMTMVNNNNNNNNNITTTNNNSIEFLDRALTPGRGKKEGSKEKEKEEMAISQLVSLRVNKASKAPWYIPPGWHWR